MPRLRQWIQLKRPPETNPAFKKGTKGTGVAIIPGGLIDLGYKMPLTMQKTGKPDGIYGNETKEVVIQFQTNEKLPDKDGIAGHDTIVRLDQLLSAKFAKVKSPPKPLKPIPPGDRNYHLGTADPKTGHDRGAGVFNSKSMEISM